MGEWVLSEFGKKKKKPINQSINSKSIKSNNQISQFAALPSQNTAFYPPKTSKIPKKHLKNLKKSIKNFEKASKTTKKC
jgi:hypothetical protein